MDAISPEIRMICQDVYDRFAKTGTHNNRRRVLKLELLKALGKCVWCGVPVKDYGDTSFRSTPLDCATIDHVVSRKYRKPGENVLKVLACMKCNSARDTQDTNDMNPHYRKAHGLPL